MKRFVAYYRVSTTKQGESGLGLEAQQTAVRRYLSDAGGVTVAEFTEVESGSRKDRPKLRDAIAHCKREAATLVIAKLDRLARNVHFVSGLMDGGVEFVAVDNPHANRLMLHLLAAFAEHEREQISRRTKDALAAAKAKGTRLGSYAAELAKANAAAADVFAQQIASVLSDPFHIQRSTLREIADQLNRKGVRTASGKSWTRMSVHRLRQRLSSKRYPRTTIVQLP